MKTEKLLIQQDKAEAEREIVKLESYIPILNQLQGVFESLDLGKLDEKTAVTILLDRGNTAGEMFLNAIAADCYATGNKNKHFVNQQVNAQKETVDNFKSEIKSTLGQINGYADFSKYNYSETDLTYYISDSSKDAIIERYKRYLIDPKEIELYQEFEKTYKAMQDLNNAISKYKGTDTFYSLMPYFENKNHIGGAILFFNKKRVLELFEKPFRF